ncbi:ATP-dependent DNA helicase PIF1 [Hirsutella rhossiliensis]|uniref:ATP-dependent DNA helicase PIF1 n=1 Tax=Hirsutella rhossiliensis TaxID=111463 RepID=A0A9P8MS87_9HYPO|nr:ATP-dependent DNA helicase PIF1 [Hirsutella rhossiliensis]KAH0959276.1 ATP-dependent DNA helicase PIF1 [Hirsutella rhossiliensis]
MSSSPSNVSSPASSAFTAGDLNLHPVPRIGLSAPASLQSIQCDEADEDVPPLDIVGPFAGDLNAQAISQSDQDLLNLWNDKLDSESLEYCSRCKESWFNMVLVNDVCSACRRRDADGKRQPHEPFLFSEENNLDLGSVPNELPELSQVEEMLIARVHVHIQVFQYRGQQYKYRGHVINFLRDIGHVYTQLPLLPRELDIIIIRPGDSTNQPHVVRQFRRQFRVRQGHIRVWLEHLQLNHPGYRDIFIDAERLSRLPNDGDVVDQMLTEEVDVPEGVLAEQYPIEHPDPEAVENADAAGIDDYDAAAVPNFIAAQADLERLRAQLEDHEPVPPEQIPLRQAHIEMPNIRSTPLNEFNRSQPLLSLAFPTLYPTGQADFVAPRQRTIRLQRHMPSYVEWREADGRGKGAIAFRNLLENPHIAAYHFHSRFTSFLKIYCSKAEKQTESYRDVARAILPRVNARQGLVSFVAKFMNKLTAERDWSAMEISHLLLSLPLQQSTRTLTYFELLTKVDFTRPAAWHYYSRAPDRVLSYFPRYKALRGNEQYEDFCRVKLTLHHPHRDPQELKEVDGTLFDTFSGAYDHCSAVHDVHPDDYYGDLPPPVEEEFQEEPRNEEDVAAEDWEELAAVLPNRGPDEDDIELLGNRDFDLAHDWQPYIGKYPGLAILGHDYWKELKALHPLGNNQDDVPDGLFDQLNVEQRTVFDLFTRHLEKALDPQQPNPAPLLVQVDGEGGTGPTDIANLQSKLRNLCYLIIDEKSMIGLRTFGYIDSRLRQIFPEYQDTFFGGHWELLCTRVQANLTLAEVTCFDGAVRIYTTNAQVRATNLPICIGARVMLTENVWTDVSLVNGSSSSSPFVIMVRFDRYTGPLISTTLS